MSALLAFSSRSNRPFDCPGLFIGMGISQTMALKRDMISMEVFGPSTGPAANRSGADRADEAISALARLIGRQIAREQFERTRSMERKARKRRANSESR